MSVDNCEKFQFFEGKSIGRETHDCKQCLIEF